MDNGEMWEYVDILGHMLIFLGIKEEMVNDSLKNIKVDESPEPDRIQLRILRIAMDEIAGGLTKIFVCCLGSVPDECSRTNVVHLFTKSWKLYASEHLWYGNHWRTFLGIGFMFIISSIQEGITPPPSQFPMRRCFAALLNYCSSCGVGK